MTETASHAAESHAVSADSTGRAPFRIQTFTARYDPIEDRIRLDAVDAQGGKQAIFLTRRLVDRVIPVIVSHLEGKTPEGVPADLSQGIIQLRAREIRQVGEAAPAVVPESKTPSWLCRTVHFQKADHGLNVTFTDDTQVDAVMPMVEANLRAVLDIFLDLYTKAGWPTERFPEWIMSDATLSVVPGQGTRLN